MLNGVSVCESVCVFTCLYSPMMEPFFLISDSDLSSSLRHISFSWKRRCRRKLNTLPLYSHKSFHNNTIFNPSVPSGRHISCLSKDNCVHRLYKCKTCLRGTTAIYSSAHPEYCESAFSRDHSLIPLHSKYRHMNVIGKYKTKQKT